MMNISKPAFAALLIVALAESAFHDGDRQLQFVVDHGQIYCFAVTFDRKVSASMEVEVEVLAGGDHDIDFYVKTSDDEALTLSSRVRHAIQRLPTSLDTPLTTGDYSICADNSFSYLAKKQVLVLVRMLDNEGRIVQDESRLAIIRQRKNAFQTVTNFESSTNKLENMLRVAKEHLGFIRIIYNVDRSLAEDNFVSVNFWAVMNTSTMLIAAGVQVFLIRALLTERSRVGKLLRWTSVSF